MANKKYKLTDGNYWATDGVYDFDQGKTQREVNGDLIGAIKYILTSTGDTTDRYSDIMYCLNNYKACVLAEGEFCISQTIGMPDNSSLSGLGSVSVLRLLDNASGQVAVNVGSYCTVENLTIKGSSTPLPYSSYTRGNRKGVSLLGDYTDFNTGTTAHNFSKLSNLTITDFNHSGIWCCKNDGAGTFLADNIDIFRCHTGINIELFSEFSSFTNCRCRNCNIGCVMQGGNNLFNGCHFTSNLESLRIDGANNTLVNPAHSSFSGCSFAHAGANNDGNLIWAKNTIYGLAFNGCNFWHGSINIQNTNSVIFDGNIFGLENQVFILIGNGNIISNNKFYGNLPTFNLGTGNSGQRFCWVNNIDNNGLPVQQYTSISTFNDPSNLIFKTGNVNMVFRSVGICFTAGEYDIPFTLPFIAGSGYTVTINSCVLLGKGNADSSSIQSTSTNYFTVKAYWSTAAVNETAMCEVNVTLARTPT